MTRHSPLNEYAKRQIILEDFLLHVTYKPGWKFSIENYEQLVISHMESCAVVKGKKARIQCQSAIPTEAIEDAFQYGNFKTFVKFIQATIVKLELHEVDEFFKVNGRHVNDPHPELDILTKSAYKTMKESGLYAD